MMPTRRPVNGPGPTPTTTTSGVPAASTSRSADGQQLAVPLGVDDDPLRDQRAVAHETGRHRRCGGVEDEGEQG